MLQVAKIERKTAEGRETSVVHYILAQKMVRRAANIQAPEGQKDFFEDLQNRIMEMGYKRLIEVSKTQTDAEFIELVRLDRSKTLN